ncbi:hypothetical protein [Clostridium saccharoperbutylacetonicum]|uniref:hypothetical protein n=1 Tax=Clostridium saccharoperbutylacetonicum TaxID=36745 RepID=UPI0039EB82E8
MYNFILNQWIMCKYTFSNIQNCINKGYITQEQANTVLATPQVTTEQENIV